MTTLLPNEPGYRFCPRCGHPLTVRQLRTGEPPRLVCSSCGFVFYLDPKVAVCTVIRTAQSGLILVRRAIEPGFGKWVVPGGYVDRGEPLHDAARREAREESGLIVRLDGLINIYSYAGQSPIVIAYAATATGGELQTDEESSEACEVSEADIPWDELAFRSTADALRDHLAGILHPLKTSVDLPR
jgi:ADP-ribose pyrophosphatase YjhB (NUDIX family)